ncbi:MAG: DUF3322 domain-containing protein [Bacteroidota bacterium]
MITPAEIRQKAARKFLPFLKAHAAGESFFPLRIPGRLASGSTPFVELSRWLQALTDHSKAVRGWGYTVELSASVNTRHHGHQSLPTGIVIETQRDFLRLIGERARFAAWQEDLARIRSAQPQLVAWAAAHPKSILAHLGEWESLLQVVAWLRAHPRPGVYLRDLPLELDTKFVETHRKVLREILDVSLPPEAVDQEAKDFAERYGLRKPPFMVRFRILDPRLRGRGHLPADDLAVPLAAFGKLPFGGCRVLVVENLATFLSLPARADSLAIWGEGAKVAGLIVPWLAKCPVHYWGDLDVQGFQFLARFRVHCPQAESVLMDAATLAAHRKYVVAGTVDTGAVPEGLTAAEAAVYTELQEGNLRLEQERVGVLWWGDRV